MNSEPSAWLEDILGQLRQARVAVFGDYCLDAYWSISSDPSEKSVETALPVRRILRQEYSLGGAGNVVRNLVDLGVGQVQAVGLIGPDLFGGQMLQLLQAAHVDTQGLYRGQTDWQTMVYAKPYVEDEELNRLDFGAFNELAPATIEQLLAQLDRAAGQCPVVILNQQVRGGISRPEVIAGINRIIARRSSTRFIVDSRDCAHLYQGAMLKLNSHEAARLVGQPRPLDEAIPADQVRHLAQQLAEQTHQPVFVTRGPNGLTVAQDSRVEVIPGIQIIERVDPVGAGDTVVAALAAVLAVGGTPIVAARLANIAASITVRKLRTTGTASPAEIRALGPDPDYVYEPERAADPRRAQYLAGTEIELVRTLPQELKIGHAIFDHDGTLSTLRQGWEEIMEPMMVRAILGPRFEDAPEGLYHKVVAQVRRYIDKTTGVQTLLQMQGLAQMVRQFGCVAPGEVLDAAGYKRLYNEELLALVQQRLAKLQRGELATEDFQIKNARAGLEALHAKGLKLYLASGTDTQDVVTEARALGYEHLFEGRIYGAEGDVSVETKRLVMEQILREHHLRGPALVTFGDGPVEMRAAHRCGGVAVGIASDEVRRFGLNPAKRARLIRAGADLILPDFTQIGSLLRLLGVAAPA